jgi:hypothetical protein
MKKWSLSVFVTLLGVSVVFGNQYKSSAIGSWSATTTWQISTDGGSSFSAASSVPGTSVSDTVLIRDGDTVTINQSAKIAALTLGGGTTGGLKYENVTTIRVLEVTGDFIMNAGSAFNHGISVTVIHQFVLGGNFSINNGAKLALYSSSSRGVAFIFNKSTSGDQTISATGTPGTMDFGFLKVRRAGDADRVLATCTMNIKGGNTGLVVTKGIFEVSAGTLILPSAMTGAGANWNADSLGTFKVSGSAKVYFTSGIAGSSSGQLGTIIINTSDTVTLGYNTTAQGAVKFDNANIFNMQSGTLNVNGRFVTSAGTSTISGGLINVDPQNKGTAGVACLAATQNPFEVSSTGTINMSGGTVCVVNPDSGSGTGLEVKISGTLNMTGGTISLGNGVASKSGSADGFEIYFASGKNPYNLTINNPSGTNRHVVMTNHTTYNSEIIGNNLTIIAGELRTTAPDGRPSNITIGGNWTNNGTYTTHDSSLVTFNGTAAQAIGGSSNTTFGRLSVTNTTLPVTVGSAATIKLTGLIYPNATLAVGATLTNSGTTTVNGNFQINDGGWATGNGFVYNSTGTLIFNNASGPYGINDDAFWPSTSGPRTVTIQNTGGISLNVARTVSTLIQTASGISNGSNLTVNGTFKINAGGYISGVPTYGSASTLVYNTGSIYGRSDEWNTTDPANVQLSNNTTLNYPNGSHIAARSLSGNLTIDSGSALWMNYDSPNPGVSALSVGGNLTLNGQMSLGNQTGGDLNVGGNLAVTGSLYPEARAVTLNGSTAQSISGAIAFDYLTINNVAGVVLNSDVTVTSALTLTAGLLNVGTHTLLLGSSAGIAGTPSASNMIVGTLGSGKVKKLLAAVVPHSFTFPVGDNSGTAEYSPVTYTLNSGTFTVDTIVVLVSNAKHANNSVSSDYINRYWTLSNSGVVNPNYTAIFTYVPADVAGTESNLSGALWNGSSWVNLGTVNTSAHTFTASNQTVFGDYSAMLLVSSGNVAVTVIPQGFYNEGDFLNSSDTIKVLLANSAAPHAFADSSYAILDSLTFTATAALSTAASGSYYLVIKHRNSIETWSAAPITFTQGSTATYDFTTAASQAYGSNLIAVGSIPRYAIYSGDVNQDGYVDPLDLSLVDQDSYNYVSGTALATDLNGDHYVDPLDLSICDQNSYNYVGVATPVSSRIKAKRSK